MSNCYETFLTLYNGEGGITKTPLDFKYMEFYAELDRASRVYQIGEPIRVTLKSKIEQPTKVRDITIVAYGVLTKDEKPHNYNKFDVGVPKENGEVFWKCDIPTDKILKVIDNSFQFSFAFTIPLDSNVHESVRGKYMSIDYAVEVTTRTSLFSYDKFWVPFKIILPSLPVKPSGPNISEKFNQCDPDPDLPPVEFDASVFIKSPIISNKVPLNGHVIIHKAADLILYVTSSIIMNESFNVNGKRVNFQSEIVKTRISERDPLIGRELPILIEWQRNFMTPYEGDQNISISYYLRVHIRFEFGQSATHDIPIILYRDLRL